MKKIVGLFLLVGAITLFSLKSFATNGHGYDIISKRVSGFIATDGVVYCNVPGDITCIIMFPDEMN